MEAHIPLAKPTRPTLKAVSKTRILFWTPKRIRGAEETWAGGLPFGSVCGLYIITDWCPPSEQSYGDLKDFVPYNDKPIQIFRSVILISPLTSVSRLLLQLSPSLGTQSGSSRVVLFSETRRAPGTSLATKARNYLCESNIFSTTPRRHITTYNSSTDTIPVIASY